MDNAMKRNIEHNVHRIVCKSKKDGSSLSYGTAIFLDGDIIITAAHVVDDYQNNLDEYEIFIPYKKENIKVKKVLGKSNSYITVFQLEKTYPNVIPLHFIIGYEVERDKDYDSYGYPEYLEGNADWLKGMTSARPTEFDSIDWLVRSPGNIDDLSGLSGAPVFIENHLVGIMQLEVGQTHVLNLGFSSSNLIREYLPSHYYRAYSDVLKVTDLAQKGFDINTISQIEIDLRSAFVIEDKFSLSFFESDDEEFIKEFNIQIKQDISNIYISGNSKEETLYTILYELRKSEKMVLVVENFETWAKLYGEITDCILIANFYDRKEFQSVPDNINIYIFTDNEKCGRNDVISLRKRTRDMIGRKMRELGINDENFFEKTQGFYMPFKRKYFNGKCITMPEWISKSDMHSKLLPALLCGQWTDAPNDQKVIEKLSGISFSEFEEHLSQFMDGEEPFIIEYTLQDGIKRYKVTNLELAWDILKDKFTKNNKVWNSFQNNFFQVITAVPLNNIDVFINQNFVLENQEYYSSQLKDGMVRSLIFIAIYLNKQNDVDAIIKNLLEHMLSTNNWTYFSQFLMNLCEASPEVVMNKLEESLNSASGVNELFQKNAVKDTAYYTQVLWTIEMLLADKNFVVRSIKWLLQMDAKNIQYKIGNKPQSVLSEVFCIWLNVVPISKSEKMQLADRMISLYDNLWNILFESLPISNLGRIMIPLVRPKYRICDAPALFDGRERQEIFLQYANLCIQNINGNLNRLIRIIEVLRIFPDDMILQIKNAVYIYLEKTSDIDKYILMRTIRDVLYKYRYFSGPLWEISSDRLIILEECLKSIVFTNKYYYYLYWFTASRNHAILQPKSYEFEKNSGNHQKDNDILRQDELKQEIKSFLLSELNIINLFRVAIENEKILAEYNPSWLNNLGYNVARYYVHGQFDRNLYQSFLNMDGIDPAKMRLFLKLYLSNSILPEDFQSTLTEIRANTIQYDPRLYAELLGFEKITDNALIFSETEEAVREYFWSGFEALYNLGELSSDNLDEISEQLKSVGNLNAYIHFVFTTMKNLSVEKVLFYMSGLKRFSNRVEEDSKYYLEQIIDFLEQENLSVDEQNQLIGIEFDLSRVLEWNNLNTLKESFQYKPDYYAMIIDKAYKHDAGEHELEESNDICIALSIKIKFCPGVRENKIDKDLFFKWLRQFNALLKKQHQESLYPFLLGKLFAYSPPGCDGAIPDENIRTVIEKMTDSVFQVLKRAYIVTEFNKRGVHYVNDGKNTKELAETYQENADKIKLFYPKTAQIYEKLYQDYMNQSIAEREAAENEF